MVCGQIIPVAAFPESFIIWKPCLGLVFHRCVTVGRVSASTQVLRDFRADKVISQKKLYFGISITDPDKNRCP